MSPNKDAKDAPECGGGRETGREKIREDVAREACEAIEAQANLKELNERIQIENGRLREMEMMMPPEVGPDMDQAVVFAENARSKQAAPNPNHNLEPQP